MLENNEEKVERAFLVGVSLGKNTFEDTDEESMAELKELAKTAGAEVVGYTIQNLKAYDPRTYIGSGKLIEIKETVVANDVSLVIFDMELSGSVTRNLEAELGVMVIDRSRLILDIFAARATSKEGKCQVELAQLKYILPRLSGIGISLSKLGGGIGTRGPGETKIESDKRHIRRRIEHLAEELKEIEKHRTTIRKKREKENIPVVALVGYTNVGKSSLMNILTDANTYVENKLFATLDPLMRKFKVNDKLDAILSDTVGFIRKLPHHLVEAFKSTLEETIYADIILHVVDSSSDELETQMKIVNNLLEDMGVTDKPIITVFNKADIKKPEIFYEKKDTVTVSAKTNENINELLNMIEEKIMTTKKTVTVIIPYTEGNLVGYLYKNSAVLSEECIDNGTKITAVVSGDCYGKIENYIEGEA